MSRYGIATYALLQVGGYFSSIIQQVSGDRSIQSIVDSYSIPLIAVGERKPQGREDKPGGTSDVHSNFFPLSDFGYAEENQLKQWITAHEAAMELGVSSSTFKRFCDLHRIPILRTPGGHRRIDRCHVDVVSHLLRTKSRTSETPEVSVEEFINQLKSADCNGLRDLLLALADTPQRMVSVLEDYLAPALWKLGDMCVAGETELAMVRICISTASTVLDSIAMWMPRVNSNRVYVGATFPQNTDTIANKIVSIGLLSIGIRPINLGPGIAPQEIASAAMICGAECIWLSHTHVDDPFALSQNHILLRSGLPNGFPVIIGGGGLSPSLRRQMPECKYYESVDSMLKGESNAPLATQ